MRRARLNLGGVLQTRERCRDAWPLRWAEDLLQDARYALRAFDERRRSLASPSPCLRSASAPTRPFSASSLPSCCGPFRTRTRTAWCESGAPCRRRGIPEAGRRCRLSSMAIGEPLVRGDGRIAQHHLQPDRRRATRAAARVPHDREHVAGAEAGAAARHGVLQRRRAVGAAPGRRPERGAVDTPFRPGRLHPRPNPSPEPRAVYRHRHPATRVSIPEWGSDRIVDAGVVCARRRDGHPVESLRRHNRPPEAGGGGCASTGRSGGDRRAAEKAVSGKRRRGRHDAQLAR